MSQQRVSNQRYPNGSGDQPVGNRRKVSPKRQVLSVVHIEGSQKQHVGHPHPCDVQPDPVAPALAARSASQLGGGEGKRSENEQVIVLVPTDRS